VEWVANGSVQFTLMRGPYIGGVALMQENSSYGYMNFEVRDNGLYLASSSPRYLSSESSVEGQYTLDLRNVDNHSVAIYHYVTVTRSTGDQKIELWNALIWSVTIAAVAVVAVLAVFYIVVLRKKKGA